MCQGAGECESLFLREHWTEARVWVFSKPFQYLLGRKSKRGLQLNSVERFKIINLDYSK